MNKIIEKVKYKIEAARLPISFSGKKTKDEKQAKTSTKQIVDDHFEKFSDKTHWNYNTLGKSLFLLENKPSVILETGSSAWGTNSSRLFDEYVNNWGGDFYSVDIRIKPMLVLRNVTHQNSHFYCNDSVAFLTKWVKENTNKKVDLVYLDSWDLDVNDPLPSAIHGLKEFFAIEPALKKGTILTIDDTPNELEMFPEEMREKAQKFYLSEGMYPGKGMLVDLYLSKKPNVEKLDHQYQTIYRFN